MRKQVVNMEVRLSQVRWGLVLTAAVVVYVVTFLLGLALSFLLLAVLGPDRPDSTSVYRASSLIGALLVIVVTGYGALWVARRVKRAAILHGLLVGLSVALISLLLDALFRPIQPVGLLLYALMVTSGLLGGILAGRGTEQS
jgi:putative membrane protein (TIGR04086 family)